MAEKKTIKTAKRGKSHTQKNIFHKIKIKTFFSPQFFNFRRSGLAFIA
jgi:hypothetical protein